MGTKLHCPKVWRKIACINNFKIMGGLKDCRYTGRRIPCYTPECVCLAKAQGQQCQFISLHITLVQIEMSQQLLDWLLWNFRLSGHPEVPPTEFDSLTFPWVPPTDWYCYRFLLKCFCNCLMSAMEFGTDIHGVQRMKNPHQVTFSMCPILWFMTKDLQN